MCPINDGNPLHFEGFNAFNKYAVQIEDIERATVYPALRKHFYANASNYPCGLNEVTT